MDRKFIFFLIFLICLIKENIAGNSGSKEKQRPRNNGPQPVLYRSPNELPQQPPRSTFDLLFPGNLSSLENFVHQNFSIMDSTWITDSNDPILPRLCALIFKSKLSFPKLNVICDHKLEDGQIVYKQIKKATPDNSKVLYCACEAPTTNTKKINDFFYVIEMGYYETEEYDVLHYIYLDSENNNSEKADELKKYFIQLGWKVTIRK